MHTTTAREPKLGVKLVRYPGYSRRCRLEVSGGLHYIAGNRSPYFSLTCSVFTGGHYIGGGADHELILANFPRLAPLAALHLADVNGAPSHAEANGWYWLAGYLGDTGERYTGANGSPSRTAEQCLEAFARHCRIELEAARELAESVRELEGATRRDKLAAELEAMRPRWRDEANDAIQLLGLVVFGDPWRGLQDSRGYWLGCGDLVTTPDGLAKVESVGTPGYPLTVGVRFDDGAKDGRGNPCGSVMTYGAREVSLELTRPR